MWYDYLSYEDSQAILRFGGGVVLLSLGGAGVLTVLYLIRRRRTRR